MVQVFRERVEQYDFTNADSFAFALLSHGDKGDIVLGSDRKPVNLEKLLEPVKKCKALSSKTSATLGVNFTIKFPSANSGVVFIQVIN